MCCVSCVFLVFFFNDTATTEIYTLSLHDALPIYRRPVRLHHHLPRRRHFQHRPGHTAGSAADVVGELHHAVHPVGRARLQPTCRRADGSPAAAAQPADPDPRAHRLARPRRPADGDRHPQRDQLGGPDPRARYRPDHGHGHVRAVPPVFSIESKDQRDSAFSLNTFSDKTFVITTSGSFVLLVLSTVLGIFQTVLKTVRLDVRQWLICTAVALSIVGAAEIRKAVLRQTAAEAIHPAGGPGPEPLPAERPSGA